MIGVIRKPNWKRNPIYDYFDPITHTAIESNFIKFLEAGIFTEEVIGYNVILANSLAYNGGSWAIADVNHDNTVNTYDLITNGVITRNVFSNDRTKDYNDSDTIRPWMIRFGNSFNISNSHMTTIYNTDKACAPSINEIYGNGYKSRGTYPKLGTIGWWLRDYWWGDNETYVAEANTSSGYTTDSESSNYYYVANIRVC